jgi:hypothetical protein
MTTRADARTTVENDLGGRKKAGPTDVVEAMYKDKDGRKDNQSKPEGEVVYQ